MVNLPEPMIAAMRNAPFRPGLEAIAHTLVYDATILGNGMLDLEQARKVRTPTLAMAAGRAAPRCSRRRCSSSSRSAAPDSTTRALALR